MARQIQSYQERDVGSRIDSSDLVWKLCCERPWFRWWLVVETAATETFGGNDDGQFRNSQTFVFRKPSKYWSPRRVS